MKIKPALMTLKWLGYQTPDEIAGLLTHYSLYDAVLPNGKVSWVVKAGLADLVSEGKAVEKHGKYAVEQYA